MSVSITVDASAAITALRNGIANIPKAIRQALDQGGSQMQALAQSIVPVRTGRLQASISYTASETELIFTASAPYSKFVEFGHAVRSGWKVKGPVVGYAAPRPFMRPAFHAVMPQLLEDLAVAIAQGFE